MSSIAMPLLAESSQALVDARLDTIDRMLLGRVPRQDRLAIVREVESQIHDLLGERDAGSIDRDDVLAVLARLDPPEAYLPDEAVDGPTVPRRMITPASGVSGRTPRSAVPTEARVAKAGGILGLISTGMVMVTMILTLLAEMSDSDGLFYVLSCGALGITLPTALLTIVLSAYARLHNAWAVVGLVTGIMSGLMAAMGTVVYFLQN